MPFFKKRPLDKLELLIDIESDLVRAAFVLFSKNQPPRILSTIVENVKRKSHTDGAYLTRLMLKKLAQVSEAAARDGREKLRDSGSHGQPVDTIHIILSS